MNSKKSFVFAGPITITQYIMFEQFRDQRPHIVKYTPTNQNEQGCEYNLKAMVHDGSNLMGKKKRQTALTMIAKIDPSKSATEEEVQEGANVALEQVGLTAYRVGTAKTGLGCGMTKYFMDLEEKPRINYDQLSRLYDGAVTTSGIYMHFVPSADFLEVTKICRDCFKHAGCFCLSQDEIKRKRKQSQTSKKNKKQSHLAHLEQSYGGDN